MLHRQPISVTLFVPVLPIKKSMENLLFDYLARYMVLTADEKIAIIELNIFKKYKRGTVLLREGQITGACYFVLKGCIRCYYVMDGEEKTTAFYTESQSLSPLCSINNKPSEYFVSCVEDCILTVGNAAMETEIFERFPRFESLCRILSAELLAKNQTEFGEFKISSPEIRYLNLLKSRPDLLQRVPQYQLASYLGITAQSLSRLRSRMVVNSKNLV